MLWSLPLLAALAMLGALASAPFSPLIDRVTSRIAFRFFGRRGIEHDLEREQLLRSASIGIPYREYAAKTYVYVGGAGIAGAVVGVYAGAGGLLLASTVGIGIESGTIAELPDPVLFALFLTTGGVVGAASAATTHAARWQLPSIRADGRARQIDAGLPRMVAFVYALTRGGMSFPDVLRTLSANERVFGEGAAEVDIAVQNIDLFNVDLVTAVQDLSENTPSEQFGTFTENLSSVLQSGGDVSEFLREQYERYRDEAEEQQAEILNVLATTAEVYVTVIVAGMLFLITILLIIGLTAGDTLFLMRVLTYVVVPAANVLFLAYLLDVTRPLRATSEKRGYGDGTATADGRGPESNGGYERSESAANHERLSAYRRLRSVRETLASPVRSAIDRPRLVLYVTVPVAVIVTAIRLPTVVSGGVDVRALDDLLIQATILLTGTFAVVYEYSRRRLKRLEAAVPDLLERLASLNEAGISIVSSFDRVRRNDIGALDGEVDRIWRDVKWGATTEEALSRFETRVRTPSVTRVVTLITNAMHASNEIAPVLRIAAEQARSDLQLRRKRRQEMFTYIVVVYISFLVFLVVIAALENVLIPSLPDASAFSGGGGAGPISGVSGGDRDAYRLVFFHTAVIQSVLSGIAAGVMGNGSLEDGMKHTTIMLSITYVVLVFVI
ncbi:type II secretion system F family protein [Natronomonas sp. LN261]|jgi:flagellar protein FlaJ|uniref:type II secretion system F family protein n=1 Tax=Natronomonas sp. LN261 TaxID=2750669 RepID=UPI0015EF202A|nr:type II secretion system F family protein [Natronomonas sp. LN261]